MNEKITAATEAAKTYLSTCNKPKSTRTEIADALLAFKGHAIPLDDQERAITLEALGEYFNRYTYPEIMEYLKPEPKKIQEITITQITPDNTSIHIIDSYPDAAYKYRWTLQGITDETLRRLYDDIGKYIASHSIK